MPDITYYKPKWENIGWQSLENEIRACIIAAGRPDLINNKNYPNSWQGLQMAIADLKVAIASLSSQVNQDVAQLIQNAIDSGDLVLPKQYEVGDYKSSAIVSDHDETETGSGIYKWLLCDGRAISRTTYSELFALISTSFGTGDGSTTFNLPNAKGRSTGFIGQGNTAEGGGTGTARSLGDLVGAETHQLTTDELAIHNHPKTVLNRLSFGDAKYSTASTATGSNAQLGLADTRQDVWTQQNTGGDTPHNNMAPTIYVGSLFVRSMQ